LIMPGKSDFLENALLKLIFNAVSDPLIASAVGSLTTLYVSLHHTDPGESGVQSTNEVNLGQYDTYARVGVVRSASGWVVTGASVSPFANIAFPATTGGSSGVTIPFFGVGELASGAGKLFYSGGITPSIVIPATTPDRVPLLTTASTITEA
jgi:hypothetical protein